MRGKRDQKKCKIVSAACVKEETVVVGKRPLSDETFLKKKTEETPIAVPNLATPAPTHKIASVRIINSVQSSECPSQFVPSIRIDANAKR